ncbi:MAG: dephospho-CoA kinase [Coxiellaceae bacterium]|nr:dephospho-CoA kinase [Coxiellaceae bacterium]
MLTIGLTGGIGSGKTSATNYFASLGITIIDADRIAHQITSKGTPEFQHILTHFGPSILQSDGNINRSSLRKIIFNDPNEKKWLESYLHPIIREIITDQLALSQSPYTIIAIPLLTESEGIHFIDRILLIDTDESLQIKRTMQRDDLSFKEAANIIKHQASRNRRIATANDIIINNGTLEELYHKLHSLHKTYLNLSH